MNDILNERRSRLTEAEILSDRFEIRVDIQSNNAYTFLTCFGCGLW